MIESAEYAREIELLAGFEPGDRVEIEEHSTDKGTVSKVGYLAGLRKDGNLVIVFGGARRAYPISILRGLQMRRVNLDGN